MKKRSDRTMLFILLALQLVAVIIYPPSFFKANPQAAILPPSLTLLFVIALVMLNTGALDLMAGRSFLVFIQGINIIMRLMMLFPHLKTGGEWDYTLLIIALAAMGISWFTIVQIEQLPLSALRFKQAEE